MSQIITCALLFIVNTLVIIVAHLLFPQQIVLGTQCVGFNWAVIHSGFVMALIITFTLPLLSLTKRKRFIINFITNFIGLWIIARFVGQFGFGITSWLVALILALILTSIQIYLLTKTLKLW